MEEEFKAILTAKRKLFSLRGDGDTLPSAVWRAEPPPREGDVLPSVPCGSVCGAESHRSQAAGQPKHSIAIEPQPPASSCT